jgi:SAM-dependent methyltransferase
MSSPPADPPPDHAVFDRRLLRARRERAAAGFSRADASGPDFLVREAALRLVERLEVVNRSFPLAAELGCHTGPLADALTPAAGIGTLLQLDSAHGMAARAAGLKAVADEEALPLKEGAFDLVVSLLSLHWVNDLPGTLIQVNRALKPDGLFLAALLGGDSLIELRHSLMMAEIALEGGVSPRVSPFLGVQDGGALLQRARFAMPVADSDRLTVTYADPLALMRDLRAMGASNAVLARRRTLLRRATLFEALRLYREEFGQTDGRVPATFELIWLTGWAPGPDQPKPLRPGSARMRLADALGTAERPAGDKATP